MWGAGVVVKQDKQTQGKGVDEGWEGRRVRLRTFAFLPKIIHKPQVDKGQTKVKARRKRNKMSAEQLATHTKRWEKGHMHSKENSTHGVGGVGWEGRGP